MSRTRRYWIRLMEELEIAPQSWRVHWRRLDSLYREKGRYYHSWRHIAHFLDSLERFAGKDNTPAMRLAAFFHDAIYDTRRSDNEVRSAELLLAFVVDVGIAPEVGADAVALVLATAKHACPEGRLEAVARLFIDCDLLILGSSPSTYRRYTENIRREYSHVALADFRSGRAGFMTRFLAREPIFHTPAISSLYEKRARKNMELELKSLV